IGRIQVGVGKTGIEIRLRMLGPLFRAVAGGPVVIQMPWIDIGIGLLVRPPKEVIARIIVTHQYTLQKHLYIKPIPVGIEVKTETIPIGRVADDGPVFHIVYGLSEFNLPIAVYVFEFWPSGYNVERPPWDEGGLVQCIDFFG